MFNNERLGEAERTLNMINMRANYFINPTMLVSAGISTHFIVSMSIMMVLSAVVILQKR